jgi:hypothetical protein
MNLKTKLFFDDEDLEREKEKSYLANIISHTDPDSEFGKKFGGLIWAPHKTIFPYFNVFKDQDYNMILGYTSDEEIVGHLAYQKHQENGVPDFRAFSCFIMENHRQKGHTYDLTYAFLSHARKKGISRIRIGKGTHPVTIKIIQRLQQNEDEYKIKVAEDGWVSLEP